MKTFLTQWAMPAWKALFARDEGPKDANRVECRVCKQQQREGVVYRCRHCFHGVHMCGACCVRAHKMNPLHFIEQWDPRRGFWLKTTLEKLGLIIDLGHAGERCPTSWDKPKNMTIISEHGIQKVKLRFCGCHRDSEQCLDLIEAGLWPGSWVRADTAITLECMHEYQLLSAQAQVNAMDYYSYLRRLTDNTCSDEVPVS